MPRKPKATASPGGKPVGPASGPAFWLFKSEPDSFSWEQQKARGKKGEPWEGVRNFLARSNMKAMRLGDRGFFYHSNVGKEIVGIVEVCALAHQDASDATGVWTCVDVRAIADMPSRSPLKLVMMILKPAPSSPSR